MAGSARVRQQRSPQTAIRRSVRQLLSEHMTSADLQYTEEEGKKLGVTGWVKNTRQGTVVGQVQGPPEKVKEMKYWLSKVGSPSSRIHRAEFTNERDISKLEIRGFGTRY